MKDKINMALKDPMLQQGFEIICKNLAELEKEAEEWLDERYLKDMGVRKPCKEAYLAGAEPREKRIAELEMTVGTLRNFSNEQATCIEKLETQIEQMKCDVLSLIKDRMNDDIDQNIIERLAEKWEIKEK